MYEEVTGGKWNSQESLTYPNCLQVLQMKLIHMHLTFADKESYTLFEILAGWITPDGGFSTITGFSKSPLKSQQDIWDNFIGNDAFFFPMNIYYMSGTALHHIIFNLLFMQILWRRF